MEIKRHLIKIHSSIITFRCFTLNLVLYLIYFMCSRVWQIITACGRNQGQLQSRSNTDTKLLTTMMVDNNYDIFVLISAVTFNNYLAALRKPIADLLVSPAGGKRWCSCFYCIGSVFCNLLGLNSAEHRSTPQNRVFLLLCVLK